MPFAEVVERYKKRVQDELQNLWHRTQRATASGRDTSSIRALLGRPPIDEATANQPEVQRQIGTRLEGSGEHSPSPLELAWRDTCRDCRAQARRKLDEIGA